MYIFRLQIFFTDVSIIWTYCFCIVLKRYSVALKCISTSDGDVFKKNQMIKTVKLAGFMSKRNHTWAHLGTAWSEGGGHSQSAQISLLSLCVWVSSCLSHLFNANREFDQEVQRDVKVNLWQKKRKNKEYCVPQMAVGHFQLGGLMILILPDGGWLQNLWFGS